MGDGNILTLHRIHTHWPITKKFVASDYVGDPYGCGKFGENLSMGGFWANRLNITNFLKNFFIHFFQELTYRSDPSTDFHDWLLKRRGLAQGCAFWRFRSYIFLIILGVKYPRKPNFWGVNRRFQAKRAKYWKFHVIETTASILTKFSTTIETVKWSSSTNPRWRTAAILKKKLKSPYLCDRSADFDKIWHDDAYWPLAADQSLKFEIYENPRWRRHNKNHKNRDISAAVWPIFTKFGTLM